MSQEDMDTIKLGDMEFSNDELQELVQAGQSLKEFEESQGQTLEDMNKSWGRRGQTIGELKSQLEEAQGKLTQLQSQPTTPEAQEVEQAKATLANMMSEMGYVKRDEVQRLTSEYTEGKALLNEMESFESQGNPYGAEALPKFDTREMLEYMSETGIRNPQKAYQDKYLDEITEWKANEIVNARPGGLHTETAGAGASKLPPDVKPDASNLEELVKQSLNR